MSFKAFVTVEKPDDVPVTISITMSLREWKTLKEQIPSDFPSWKIKDIIYASLLRITRNVEIRNNDLSTTE